MFGISRRVQSLNSTTTVAGASTSLSDYIKSLGITIDTSLTFDQRTRNICKASYLFFDTYERPCSIRLQIPLPVPSSAPDYCHVLLAHGWIMAGSILDKLQRVQNCQGLVVIGARRRDHIKPVLKELHWLTVRAKISFKIATLVHNARTSH